MNPKSSTPIKKAGKKAANSRQQQRIARIMLSSKKGDDENDDEEEEEAAKGKAESKGKKGGKKGGKKSATITEEDDFDPFADLDSDVDSGIEILDLNSEAGGDFTPCEIRFDKNRTVAVGSVPLDTNNKKSQYAVSSYDAWSIKCYQEGEDPDYR